MQTIFHLPPLRWLCHLKNYKHTPNQIRHEGHIQSDFPLVDAALYFLLSVFDACEDRCFEQSEKNRKLIDFIQRRQPNQKFRAGAAQKRECRTQNPRTKRTGAAPEAIRARSASCQSKLSKPPFTTTSPTRTELNCRRIA